MTEPFLDPVTPAPAQSRSIVDVAAQHQQNIARGRTRHDAALDMDEMLDAARAYIELGTHCPVRPARPACWPALELWPEGWCEDVLMRHFGDRRGCLIHAAALILHEIDRMDAVEAANG